MTNQNKECFTESGKESEQLKNADVEQGFTFLNSHGNEEQVKQILEAIETTLQDNPSPAACGDTTGHANDAESTKENQPKTKNIKNDEKAPNVLVSDTPIGPLNLTMFDVHQKFEEVSMSQLKELGKRDLSRIILILISQHNSLVDTVIDLEAAASRAKEKAGRATQTSYGSKSERRSTLEGNPEKPKGDDTANPKEEPKTVSTENPAGADIPTADKDANQNPSGADVPPADKEANQNPQGQENHSKEEKQRPKRKAGCAAKVIQEGLHMSVQRDFKPEELEAMFPDGDFTKLSPTCYEYVIYVQFPVVVHVEAERIRNNKTAEIVCAAPANETKFLPKSTLTSELLARLMFMRYSMGLSVTRILKDLETKGLKYTRQSIYRWSIQYALALMRPMVTRLLQKALESGKLQTDESWMKVREELKEQHRTNSVIWLIQTSERLGLPPIVVLTFTGSRAAEELAKIIKGFSGTLISDGYAGYGKLLREYADTLILVGCLQHARSRFVDCVQAMLGKKEYQKLTTEQRAKLPFNQILDLFEKVFHAEKQMDMAWSLQEKKTYREEQVKPLMNELFQLIESEHARVGKNTLGYYVEALDYAIKYKDRFYLAVADPEMPLHNSAAERTFASFGILRSNFKQIDSVLGAEACCMWFSVLQTARRNDVNEQTYLEFLLEKLPEALKKHGDYHWMSIQQLQDKDNWPEYANLQYLDIFMPWSEEYKAYEAQSHDRQKQRFIELASLLAQQEGIA